MQIHLQTTTSIPLDISETDVTCENRPTLRIRKYAYIRKYNFYTFKAYDTKLTIQRLRYNAYIQRLHTTLTYMNIHIPKTAYLQSDTYVNIGLFATPTRNAEIRALF